MRCLRLGGWVLALMGCCTSVQAQQDAATATAKTETGPSPFDKLRAQDDKSKSSDFFSRLIEFYREDWKGTAPAGPAPARRGIDQPLSSPPWPFADWPYGGAPVIGEPDGNSYPL